MLEEWQREPLNPSRDAEYRWRMTLAQEIATLEFEHLVSFYRQEEDDAAEDVADGI